MRWKTWIGLLVSVLFLYLSFRKVDLGEMKSALSQAQYLYVLPSIVFLVVGFWIRALRWKILLQPVKPIGMRPLFSATMIGFMANNVLPARLGEFIRADAIGRQAAISRSAAFATIVVERLFDGLTLLLFLVAPLAFASFPDWVRRAGISALGLYGLSIAFLYLLHVRTETAVQMARYLLRPLPGRISEKLIKQLKLFASGLDVLSQGRHLFSTSGLSLVLWMVNIASLQCILEAFNLDLPWYAAFTVEAILALGVVLPSSPGFVGVFQGFCILALALFGISQGVALGFSVVLHASGYIPVTAIGLVYFWKAHLSFKDISGNQEIRKMDRLS
ncbi:MAG: hypothetical protein A3F84_28470 [Candidatus Handelsmanbacteria bacterium RIFCSPLOWO2_12_FULL_64_10]|uniref:TIGR00374 family protein n=1 Tax=Handelsmanbacteria sp. (strain RIFCSPLOWO2_12_FULL_64_10) TaxID=1817868 RepID=A0A1F6CKN0_HANXR|nr:MAG: hypothetical protein A3F84_28470 [Candidatus Handelsmanbacteria bacterium RIFCSPLOWO2_12_FULL_64_10]